LPFVVPLLAASAAAGMVALAAAFFGRLVFMERLTVSWKRRDAPTLLWRNPGWKTVFMLFPELL